MTEAAGRYTRGKGLLEPDLARRRARQANQLIPEHLRGGRILDIGCGSFPFFLAHTSFREKVAIDQLPPAAARPDIAWHTLDLNSAPRLPLPDGHFTAVTLLAVVEHLDPTSLVQLLKEVRGGPPCGWVVITTPAPWSDGLQLDGAPGPGLGRGDRRARLRVHPGAPRLVDNSSARPTSR